jgi:hypothetical protein
VAWGETWEFEAGGGWIEAGSDAAWSISGDARGTEIRTLASNRNSRGVGFVVADSSWGKREWTASLRTVSQRLRGVGKTSGIALLREDEGTTPFLQF